MSIREMLFRGKRIDNGEWVCSRSILTVIQNNKYLHFIPQQGEDFKADPDERNGRILTSTEGNYYQVDYETVGQYIGITDKNGKKIFEGDILKHYHRANCCDDWESCLKGYVFWDKEYCSFRRTSSSPFREAGIGVECIYEIIGNIYDNPELLEVE